MLEARAIGAHTHTLEQFLDQQFKKTSKVCLCVHVLMEKGGGCKKMNDLIARKNQGTKGDFFRY